jgi:hypothetical protein
MHFLITKVGADLDNRFLQSPRVSGSQFSNVFSDSSRKWKIHSKRLAQLIASDLQNVRILWVDGDQWGQLND